MVPETDTLTHMLDTYLNAFRVGRGSVFGNAWSLLSILASLELVIASLFWALSGNEAIAAMIKKVLVIGFFSWVITSWDYLVSTLVAGFISTGSGAAEAAGGIRVSLENPSGIIDSGFQAVFPIFDHIRMHTGFTDVISNLPDILLTLFASLVIIGSYFVLAIQVFVTRLEFGLIATVGLILVPFGVLKQTAFLTEKIFGAVISFGVKLMVLSFIISITFPVLAQYRLPVDPSWPQLFSMMAIALAVMALAWHAPGVAASLLSGTPSLTTGGFAKTAIGAGAAAVGASNATRASSGLISQAGASATKSAASAINSSAHGAAFGAGVFSGARQSPGSTVGNLVQRSGMLAGEGIKRVASPLSSAKDSLKEAYTSGKEIRINSRSAEDTGSDNAFSSAIKSKNKGANNNQDPKDSKERKSSNTETSKSANEGNK